VNVGPARFAQISKNAGALLHVHLHDHPDDARDNTLTIFPAGNALVLHMAEICADFEGD
jgi:hypothetical protein